MREVETRVMTVMVATGNGDLDRHLANLKLDRLDCVLQTKPVGPSGGLIGYREAVYDLVEQYRPQVLVLSDNLQGRMDILEIVAAVTGLGVRVVFIADHSHKPGDPFLSKLVDLHVHDILIGETIQLADIEEAIFYPGDYQKVKHLQQVWTSVPAAPTEEAGQLAKMKKEEPEQEEKAREGAPPAPAASVVVTKVVVERRVVGAFWPVVPGAGASTLAFYTAKALAEQGVPTLLVELDWMFPSLAMRTGLSHPQKNILSAVEAVVTGNVGQARESILTASVAAELVGENPLVHKALRLLPERLGVLCLPEAPPWVKVETAWGADKKSWLNFIQFLVFQSGYERVIFDLSSNYLHPSVSVALNSAFQVWAVCASEWAAVACWKRSVPVLEKQGFLLNERVRVVLNRYADTPGMTPEAVREVTGVPVLTVQDLGREMTVALGNMAFLPNEVFGPLLADLGIYEENAGGKRGLRFPLFRKGRSQVFNRFDVIRRSGGEEPTAKTEVGGIQPQRK